MTTYMFSFQTKGGYCGNITVCAYTLEDALDIAKKELRKPVKILNVDNK